MAQRKPLGAVEVVQNSALGASLLWRFGLGYQNEGMEKPPSMLLMFLVLPICFHSATLASVLSTRMSSGLSLFAAKVGETREDLLAIQHRALALRPLSLDSLAVGARSQLLSIEYSQATVRSNTIKAPEVATRIKPMWDGATKLGHWSARLELAQVASTLMIDF